MTEDQLKFFDLNAPCPEDIINCEPIKEQYRKEYESLKGQGGCGGCIERALRNKYIVLISSMIKK